MRVDSPQHVPWYDVKLLSDVIKPVLTQGHPHIQTASYTTSLRRQL